MADERSRRRYSRIEVAGTVRVLIDTPNGLVTTNGQIIDMSEGGCALRLYRPVDSHVAGRVNVELAGRAIWLPIYTCWVRSDARGWTVGCEFDRPTPEKVLVIRKLMVERRRLTA